MARFGGSQFRENAIVRNAQPEPLDDRAELTAPREWIVLAWLGLALAALVAWGAFGSVERTLRFDGALVLSGDRRTVLSPFPGVIAETLAGEGDRVVAGQPILRVAPAGPERPAGLSAASVAALEGDAKRLLALARALLNDVASLREPVAIASPEDGAIAAILAAPGESVALGSPVAEFVSGDGGRLDAVAFVPREGSWPLSAGMAARVTVETPEGRQFFPAELTVIEPRAAIPPGWLARMLPVAAVQGWGHLLRLAISDRPASRSPSGDDFRRYIGDGSPCRIEIVLERVSPFALLIRP